MNSKIISWLRSNVLIVALAAVLLAAPPLGFVFASGLAEKVRTEAQARAQKLSQLEALQRTQVTLAIPGETPISVSTVVNRRLIERYEQIVRDLQRDAGEVRDIILRQNRQSHDLIIPRLFPEMPIHERDTLPQEMFERVRQAYVDLLKQVRGGTPPSAVELARGLAVREEQYITANLRKASRRDLSSEELAALTKELSNARLARYGDAAQAIGMYIAPGAIPVPPESLRSGASPRQLFGWQWNFWIVSDVLNALHDANVAVGGEQGSVVSNPVKRVLSLRILDGIDGGSASAGGPDSTGTPTGGGATGRRQTSFGDMTGMNRPGRQREPELSEEELERRLMGEDVTEAPRAQSPAATMAAPSIATSASLDYQRSLTGRVSNPLYDVRMVELRLVASFEHLPVILDAIAGRNLMTVLGMDLRTADPFQAAARGFIYGSEPIVEVTLLIETIWLREWTVPFMPAAMKDFLKIAPPAPPMAP
ncbi:MAG TPA: hypothetical protein PKC43_14560 [Phycisphaerales bacterium]|nr:hypothetical protein [Phycisphaerales bacterium]HMP38656.1 hypothetical protein [Phycisphaerales bacterium]